jgi:hypothetical protein
VYLSPGYLSRLHTYLHDPVERGEISTLVENLLQQYPERLILPLMSPEDPHAEDRLFNECEYILKLAVGISPATKSPIAILTRNHVLKRIAQSYGFRAGNPLQEDEVPVTGQPQLQSEGHSHKPHVAATAGPDAGLPPRSARKRVVSIMLQCPSERIRI